MKIIEVGSRGLIFEFEDPYLINVYVIMCENRVYICDTFCGPASMSKIIERVRENGYKDQQIRVFNSHHHYDHIWGNCAFQETKIFSHHKCRDLIEERGQGDLVEFNEHKKGDVRIVMPSMTFSEEIIFHDDCVKFFYSPGHTVDSASCMDMQDRVLFVADNVEAPVPYLYNADFGTYLKTLERYNETDWDYMLSSHDHLMHDDVLLRQNMKYLNDLLRWDVSINEFSERAIATHVMNLIEIASELNIESDSIIKHHYARVLEFVRADEMRAVPDQLVAKLSQLLN